MLKRVSARIGAASGATPARCAHLQQPNHIATIAMRDRSQTKPETSRAVQPTAVGWALRLSGWRAGGRAGARIEVATQSVDSAQLGTAVQERRDGLM
jgi:hypothetical protein